MFKRANDQNNGIFGKVLFYAGLLVTVAAAAALIMALLSMYVNPNKWWVPSFFGLIAPFIYLVNVVMLFLWVVRWNFVAFVPLFALLLGVGKVNTFFKPSLKKEYHADKTSKSIRILDYNVRGFMNRVGGQVEYQFKDIAAFMIDEAPDIICMQEFETKPAFAEDSIASYLGNYPYRSVYYKKHNSLGQGTGLAIFSKYPIIKRVNIDFGEGTNNSSQYIDVTIGRDTVRVINNHLQSTQLNEVGLTMAENTIDLRAIDESHVKRIGMKLRLNYRRRAYQADTIASVVAATRYPMILCGDFNDTPISYTYRTIRGKMEDTFVEKGRGFHYTYKYLFRMLRIDYIFHSSHFETLNFRSPYMPWSDHIPVIAEIRFKSKR